MRFKRRTFLQALSSVPMVLSGWVAFAQERATKGSMRLLQGFPAGGAPDTVGRMIAPGLQKGIGRTVIMESKIGAAERVVAHHVSKSPPDGEILLLYTGAQAVHAALDKSVQYDILKDFTHIAGVTKYGFIICVAVTSPYKTLSDLLKSAAREPGRITYSSPGIGSTLHLAGERLCAAANVKMLHVPYNNLNNYIDLVSGTLDVVIGTYSSSIALLNGGRLRALAVTSRERFKALPDVPSVEEFVQNSNMDTFIAMAGPLGLDQKLVSGVRSTLKQIQSDPKVLGELERKGFNIYRTTPGELEHELETTITVVRMIAARAGIDVSK